MTSLIVVGCLILPPICLTCLQLSFANYLLTFSSKKNKKDSEIQIKPGKKGDSHSAL